MKNFLDTLVQIDPNSSNSAQVTLRRVINSAIRTSTPTFEPHRYSGGVFQETVRKIKETHPGMSIEEIETRIYFQIVSEFDEKYKIKISDMIFEDYVDWCKFDEEWDRKAAMGYDEFMKFLFERHDVFDINDEESMNKLIDELKRDRGSELNPPGLPGDISLN